MGSVVLAVIWKLVAMPEFGGDRPEPGERGTVAAERIRTEMGEWFSAQRLLGHAPPFLDAFSMSIRDGIGTSSKNKGLRIQNGCFTCALRMRCRVTWAGCHTGLSYIGVIWHCSSGTLSSLPFPGIRRGKNTLDFNR